MSGFLDTMAAASRLRVADARRICPESSLLAAARELPVPALLRPGPDGFDLIAEVKFRSPAAGMLQSAGEDIDGRVLAYAQAGAAAVSILTEPTRFDGAPEHLQQAARTLRPHGTPVMRKDFLVDPYQVIEARVWGASGVLVIVRMLSQAQLEAILACARELGLFALLEAFDEPDLERVCALADSMRAGQQLLAGLNCRDLVSLQIVPGRLEALASLLPSQLPRVAESGVSNAQDAARVARAGYQFALVGSALMQGGDPHQLAARMLAAGRQAIPS